MTDVCFCRRSDLRFLLGYGDSVCDQCGRVITDADKVNNGPKDPHKGTITAHVQDDDDEQDESTDGD